jgi:hypothetical protein
MNQDIYEINRLIYLSMAYSNDKKRFVFEHRTETHELMQRYQADRQFKDGVDEGLRAMELRVLAMEDEGLHLSSASEYSLFACNLTDYGKMLVRGDYKAADILCIHCAIATGFFPTEADLDAPIEDLGVIVIRDVIEIIRRFALTAADPIDTDDAIGPQVRTVAQRISELPEENPDSRRAGTGSSWLDMIVRIIDHMVETGYLLKTGIDGEEIEYRATPAYQAAMREGIVYAFHAFRDAVGIRQER